MRQRAPRVWRQNIATRATAAATHPDELPGDPGDTEALDGVFRSSVPWPFSFLFPVDLGF